jgi:hypothetical protein
LVDEIRPVGDQSAGGDEVACEVHRRQFVPGRKRADHIAMTHRQPARRHEQAAIVGAREGRDHVLDLGGVAAPGFSIWNSTQGQFGIVAKKARSGQKLVSMVQCWLQFRAK